MIDSHVLPSVKSGIIDIDLLYNRITHLIELQSDEDSESEFIGTSDEEPPKTKYELTNIKEENIDSPEHASVKSEKYSSVHSDKTPDERENTITEEQMLDTAEDILNQLAQKLI